MEVVTSKQKTSTSFLKIMKNEISEKADENIIRFKFIFTPTRWNPLQSENIETTISKPIVEPSHNNFAISDNVK